MWNNKGAKMLSEHFYDDTDSELIVRNNGKEYRVTEMYEDISLRLQVISEIIDEILEMYPEQREKLDVEKRIQQKLMLRKLAGE